MATVNDVSPLVLQRITSAIVVEAGVDLDQVKCSLSTAARKLKKANKEFASIAKEDIKAAVNYSQFPCIVHFDGKTLYEINKGKKFKNERLAVLVNIKGGSCLLGVPALPASTGEDQYNGVMKLLDEFSIKNKVGGLCFDTTSSITGIHKGALTRICNELGRTLLLLACKHHVTELRMVHFWETVTGEKTSGPDNPLFKALKNTFENPEYDYDPNKIVKFDWQATKETIIESSAADALTYCKAYVFQKDIVRKDRKELAELVITYLSETNLKIRKPGEQFTMLGFCQKLTTISSYNFLPNS